MWVNSIDKKEKEKKTSEPFPRLHVKTTTGCTSEEVAWLCLVSLLLFKKVDDNNGRPMGGTHLIWNARPQPL